MRAVTARWVAEAVRGTLAADPEIAVMSVVRDSRESGPGALYVALPGERADGHDFVGEAAQRGAVLHMVSRPVDRPHVLVRDCTEALGFLAAKYLSSLRESGRPTVIGVTGSVGKTTTKDLLSQILPGVVVPVGSYNNEIGLPLTVLRAKETTENLVLEMGANGVGHIAYLCGIAPPDVAVVLAIGSAHLGEYASMDELARTKAEILTGSVDGATAILNADDPRVAAMAVLAERVTTFGIDSGDVRAEELRTEEGRARFVLVSGGERAEVALRLVGRHNVSNALAAAAVALDRDMPISEVAERLSEAHATSPHRMAVVERSDGVTVIDDSYNASPESMRAALDALREMAPRGRTIAVLGEMLEMGEASAGAHEELGCQAARLGLDGLVVVGEGARAAYDAAVREGLQDRAVFVATVDEAARYLDAFLVPGDTVLVKSSHGSGLWELADRLVEVGP
ncbi:MAG: UDP-N-acetylmuramoyl-tripeptide--D-alanyl-D-alanine ligase [Demequinaceae bacterium]|nr:UDP-N-acetylmuramoyl-tripeptide--D-alanyl-D-alanine ligase [Demequinaceae bacterium]